MTRRLIIIGLMLAAVTVPIVVVGLSRFPFALTATARPTESKTATIEPTDSRRPQVQAALDSANDLLRQAYPEAYQTLEQTAAREGHASMIEALQQLDQTVATIDQEVLEATRPLLNQIQGDDRVRPADYGRALIVILELIRAVPINLDNPDSLRTAARAYRDYVDQLMKLTPPPGFGDLHRFWVATTAGKAYAFAMLGTEPVFERRFVLLRLLNEIVDAETKAIELLNRTTTS